MRNTIGFVTGAMALFAASSAAAGFGPAAAGNQVTFDVDQATAVRLAADVDETGSEDGRAADGLAPEGNAETPEEDAPLRQQINDALDEIKDDGTLDELNKKYFPSSEQPGD